MYNVHVVHRRNDAPGGRQNNHNSARHAVSLLCKTTQNKNVNINAVEVFIDDVNIIN